MMTNGVGQREWNLAEVPAGAAAPIIAPAVAIEEADGSAPSRAGRRDRWIAALLLLAGLGWIAGLVATLAVAAPAQGLGPMRLAAWFGLACAPLALIGVLALLLLRTGRSEAAGYARAAARLRAESVALAELLTFTTRRIEQARDDLAVHGGALATIGEATQARLGAAGAGLRADGEALAATARALDDATATARTDLGVLLADLPEAEARARALAAELRALAGLAGDGTAALDAQLRALADQARAADGGSAAAARRLALELERIEGGAAAADRRVGEAADRLGAAADEALAGTVDALDQVRRGMAEQGAALAAMTAQGRVALAAAGEDATRGFGERVAELTARLDAMGSRLREEDAGARALVDGLDRALGAVEARLAGLGEAGEAPVAALAAALATLAGHADGIGRAVEQGSSAADTLVDRAVALRGAIEASGAQITGTLPAALGRLRLQADQGLQAIAQAEPRVAALAVQLGALPARLGEADATIGRQGAALADLAERASAFKAAIAASERALAEVAGGASANLVDALLRVQGTATQAAAHARAALADAVPEAASGLAEAAARAMAAALTGVGQGEIAALGATSEQAAEAARGAAERLNRQLLALTETARAAEARIAEHRAAAEAEDEGAFARRVGLLIEALNSTAIDVAKLFSNQPADGAWAAYLKGDRGVFTRRAVRLLDAAEARAIAARYADDAEFHEQVNRYVHDFEAMLRRVLAVREGGAMGVALVSSDAGKLYVALAQAIERLRR